MGLKGRQGGGGEALTRGQVRTLALPPRGWSSRGFRAGVRVLPSCCVETGQDKMGEAGRPGRIQLKDDGAG